MQRAVVLGVQVGELLDLGDEEGVVRTVGLGRHETARPRDGDHGRSARDAVEPGDPLEQGLLEVRRRDVGDLRLRDPEVHLRALSPAVRQHAADQGRPADRPLGQADGPGPAAIDPGQAMGEPLGQLGCRALGEAVAAGIAAGGRRGTGGAQEVGPRARQELRRDHLVLVALRDEHGQPGESSRLDRDTSILEGQRPVEDRGPGVPRRVGQHEPAGERRPTTEAGQDDGPSCRGDLVEPGAEPRHRLGQALGDRPPDAAVGEPRVAAPLADGRAHGGVRRTGRQVTGEADDVALVGATAVQQHDQRPRRVVLAGGPGDDGVGEGAHRAGPAWSMWPAVRTPPQVRTSAARSSRSTGASCSKRPQSARGSIHMTSNSLPSGSLP